VEIEGRRGHLLEYSLDSLLTQIERVCWKNFRLMNAFVTQTQGRAVAVGRNVVTDEDCGHVHDDEMHLDDVDQSS